jgi:transposase
MRKSLTAEQVLKIPEYRNKGHTDQEIANMLGISRKTVTYWVKRLRDEGYEIKRFGRGGRPKLKLK